MLQSTALLEFYLVKNIAVTNELIDQLDNVLKGDETLASSIKQDTKEPDENKKEDGSTTVSELFGDTETNVDPSNKDENTIDDILLSVPKQTHHSLKESKFQLSSQCKISFKHIL